MSVGKVPLSAIILTFNEETNLPACLASLAGWVGEIFVVDSGSSDGTSEIARAYGCTLVSHPFETHAKQWQWALDTLPLAHEWVLGLDADQRLLPALRDELTALFCETPERLEGIEGLYIKRRQIFRGHWIRHGTYYPKYLLKLFRRSRVRLDERDLMDHHFYVSGPVAKLNYDMVEDNQKEQDLTFWLSKHLRYARLHAEEERLRGSEADTWLLPARFFGSPDERIVWLKRLWYRLPLFVRPTLYFVYRYLFRLGFLDGKEGFIFHFLQGFWYRLLVDIHLHDMRKV